MMPWERFARRRLALTRWHCEPENIPASHQQAFDRAWARQRQLELAVVAIARDANVTDELRNAVAASLAPQLDECPLSSAERQAVIAHHARLETQFAEVARTAPLPDEVAGPQPEAFIRAQGVNQYEPAVHGGPLQQEGLAVRPQDAPRPRPALRVPARGQARVQPLGVSPQAERAGLRALPRADQDISEAHFTAS